MTGKQHVSLRIALAIMMRCVEPCPGAIGSDEAGSTRQLGRHQADAGCARLRDGGPVHEAMPRGASCNRKAVVSLLDGGPWPATDTSGKVKGDRTGRMTDDHAVTCVRGE
ncbi:hypothetical protein GCM10009646_19550 [Streptomyces aureus]